MNRFVQTAASLNEMEALRPPAFVQPAALRNCAYYKQRIQAIDEAHAKTRGELLKEFKESGAWKEEYKTWDDCCNLLLDMTRRNANLLISQIGKEISHPADVLPPASHINDPPKPKPSTVPATTVGTQAGSSPTQPAVAKGPSPTAPQPPKDNHKPEPKPPMDASGAIIPQNLLKLVQRNKEVTEAAYWASKLKCLFERLQTDQDPVFSNLQQSGNVQTYMNGAASMHHAIVQCAPEIVCPVCDGTGLHDHTDHRNGNKLNWCYECCGNGLICEVRWNRDWVKSNDRIKQSVVAKRAENLCC